MNLRAFLFLWLTGALCFGADQDSAKPFFAALRGNDLSALKALPPGDVNARGERETTPLIFAAAYGSLDAMRLLLDEGADVNAQNALGCTALMWSVGEPAKVKLLLSRGADVKLKAKNGRTALMVAAMGNDSDKVVQALLAKGADPLGADNTGLSFLLAASVGANLNQVRWAVERGANVNSADTQGGTALMIAAANRDLQTADFLVAHKADVNAKTSDSLNRVKNGPIMLGHLTPLMLAAPAGPPELVRLLIGAGANVEAKDVRGLTALHMALGTEGENPQIVAALLKAGALPDEEAIQWADKFRRPDVMKLFPASSHNTSLAPEALPSGQPPAPRVAVERSLQLLNRVSGSFIELGGCAACHAQNLTAMANGYAQAHGLPINEKAQQGMAGGVKAFFSGSRDGFLMRMDPPGGIDTILYTLLHLSAADAQPDTTTDALLHFIAVQQLRDGSWHNGGIARAPMEDSDITRTALAIRALARFSWPGRQAELQARKEAARAWLLRAKPLYNEEHAMQILGLAWAGDHTTVPFAAKLIAQQRTDGGWGQNPNLPSDAYATGQTLLALAESGALKPSAPEFQKGVQYLLSTQHPDGSWHVKSRSPKFQPYFQSGFPYDHDQWISMAGTAWAVSALTFSSGFSVVAAR